MRARGAVRQLVKVVTCLFFGLCSVEVRGEEEDWGEAR